MPDSASGQDDTFTDEFAGFITPATDDEPIFPVPDAYSAVDVLDSSRPRSLRSTALMIAATLLLIAGFIVTARMRAPGVAVQATGRPHQAPAPTRAPDVSLVRSRRYVVSAVAVTTARQTLWVDYEPTPTTRYAGGTIILYASHEFDARSFERIADRTDVGDHAAYVGSYRHQVSVAWPVRGGRWVCLSGFIGTGNGTGTDISRAEELTVAAGVLVQ